MVEGNQSPWLTFDLDDDYERGQFFDLCTGFAIWAGHFPQWDYNLEEDCIYLSAEDGKLMDNYLEWYRDTVESNEREFSNT